MKRRQVLRLFGAGAASALAGCVSPEEVSVAGQRGALSACVESGRVAILGGGVSGMSAAHELAERGFEVTVYEFRDMAGGKARSMGKPGTGTQGRRDLPGEHGFRFFPGFYKHLPDVMRRIPYAPTGRSVFENLTPASRFLMSQANAPDVELPVRLRKPGDLLSALTFLFGPNITGVPLSDVLFFVSRIERWLKSCDRRRYEEYERISWWEYVQGDTRSEGYRKFLATGLTRTLVAAQAECMSARSAASVFVQLVQDIVLANDGMDRLLNGPTNDVWLDPWRRHLENLGVHYVTGARVEALELEGNRITAANLTLGGEPCRVTAELFVSALPVEVVRRLITDDMRRVEPRLAGLSRLQTEWMTGLQFFLDRDVAMVHGHATFFDSPWALTAISQAQFWPNVDLSAFGDGSVRGILSVDISDWQTPGILFGKPAHLCTEAEIREEVWAQLAEHWDDATSDQFRRARVVDIHLDPAIVFDPVAGTRNEEPLLVNTVDSWQDRPEAVTNIANLFLAGDYVRTSTDLATMEAANESARRAVNGILRATRSRHELCALFPLEEPAIYELARFRDAFRYAFGLPPP